MSTINMFPLHGSSCRDHPGRLKSIWTSTCSGGRDETLRSDGWFPRHDGFFILSYGNFPFFFLNIKYKQNELLPQKNINFKLLHNWKGNLSSHKIIEVFTCFISCREWWNTNCTHLWSVSSILIQSSIFKYFITPS